MDHNEYDNKMGQVSRETDLGEKFKELIIHKSCVDPN
jgi:hypothetical protein